MTSSAGKPDTVVPTTLRGAVGLLSLQAAALAVIALWLVVADLRASSSVDTKLGWAVTVSALIGAALFGGYAWALSRCWKVIRGLAVATELTLMAPAYFMITGGLAWLGVLIAGICVATMVMLVMPDTNRALGY